MMSLDRPKLILIALAFLAGLAVGSIFVPLGARYHFANAHDRTWVYRSDRLTGYVAICQPQTVLVSGIERRRMECL